MNSIIELKKSLSEFDINSLRKIASRFNMLKISFPHLGRFTAKVNDAESIELHELKQVFEKPEILQAKIPTVSLSSVQLNSNINVERNSDEDINSCFKEAINFTLKNMKV